jgi:creatinine amidohydrolase
VGAEGEAVTILTDRTWQEVRAAAAAGAVAVVPTGSLEQHGPHLPVRTDTALVTAVAEAALQRLPADVAAVLVPTLWLGASDHHLPFFAVSVDERTYVQVAADIGRSLSEAGFHRVFFLNGHGGNAAALRLAVGEIARRHPGPLAACAEYWTLAAAALRQERRSAPGGAAHACEVETALMMHVAPGAVRHDRLRRAVPDLPPPFVRDLIDAGPVTLGIAWDRLSAYGTLGDPTLASADQGERMLDGCAAAAATAIAAFARLDPSPA